TLKRGGKYAVPNPELPTLKEELLLNDVKISSSKSAEETISLVFDCAFYLFFFGIIFVAFRKFISPNTFKVVRKTGVTFKDVTGMNQLKKDMLQIIDIMQHPVEYAKKGIRMPKGVLLEGAPGNGKTLFARALAGEGKINFIPAKATDFESMFMAIGPLKVKLLFKKARRHAPCIVFIDEFDGIGTKRNYSGSAIETENTRIVTALLNELDGFTPNQGILVLAATNSRKALDEALIRAGRFDAKYVVPFPDFEMRKELAVRFLEAKQYELDVSAESLAKLFDGFCAAQIESVINKAALIAGQLGRASFSMNDIKTAMKEI
ncbi:MAG: AAA family ATPase, partial [Spirochaetaceae bacterium]|nr:AAA family ATPase [Spirochaetaceae bacterium]